MKLFLTLFIFLDFCYQMILYKIGDDWRKKPLPIEVSDVYDEKRYQTFIDYKNDNRKLSLINKVISLIIDLMILYSNFFLMIEKFIGNHPYLLVIATSMILLVVNMIISYFIDYHKTFVIDEKYGKNKKDLKEFHKDFFLDLILEISLTLVIYSFMTFVCETIGHYTDIHTISYLVSFLLCVGILSIFMFIIVFFSFMSYLTLKKQYTFIEMEDNDLRRKIESMMDGCKKKVSKIQIYNESKKSTSKNAFLLKLLWIREFGIADNFMNENSENELLAVLAHEIGHLKHKKDKYDYFKYFIFIVIGLMIVWMIPNNQIIKDLNAMILSEFNLTYNNYYLSMIVISLISSPFMIVLEAILNTITRIQEYEADCNSVAMGYGEELIQTFKRISNDELVDVYPAPFIEMTSYNHPGMYNRIKAIQKEMKVRG